MPLFNLRTDPMTTLARCLALTLAALLAIPVLAQEEEPTPISLQPKWVAGQTAYYHYWSKSEKTETAEMLDQKKSETTTVTNEMKIRWTVEEVADDGSATCTFKFETIKVKIATDDQDPLEIDSENPKGEPPLLDDLVSAMIDTPMTIKVNADGSIESIQGIDKLNEAAGQDAVDADVIPDELDFKQSASELATLVTAPAQATPGQTWNTKHTWNHEKLIPRLDTKAKWDIQFTYDSVGEIEGVPIATVTTDATYDIQVDLSELPENGPQVDIQINEAKGNGEILFDLSRHEAVARNETASYSADITLTTPNPRIPPIKVAVTGKSIAQVLRISETAEQ